MTQRTEGKTELGSVSRKVAKIVILFVNISSLHLTLRHLISGEITERDSNRERERFQVSVQGSDPMYLYVLYALYSSTVQY
jgi:hypothetical protein